MSEAGAQAVDVGGEPGSSRLRPPVDVFISYGSDDIALARELRGHLEEGGYRCWMAPDDVSGPATWAEQIVDAIAGCQVVLVLISSVSNQSTHVSKEVDLALEHGKAVLPVRVEDVAPTGALKYLLALAQWIDVFPGPLGPHAEEVRRRVAAIMEASGERKARPSRPAPQPSETSARSSLAGRLRRWWWAAGIAVLAIAGGVVGLVALLGGSGAGPSVYGDDPALDLLMDRCSSGDMASCDTLLAESPADTEYWLFASTCGERLDLGGDCQARVELVSRYGDSPVLDGLWDACTAGEMPACDELAVAAPLATEYWEFGDSCGGRQPAGGGGCVDLDLSGGEAFGYGDDPRLDELWDACAAEDFPACQTLYMESPIDSEYEAFGGSCGGRIDGGEGCFPFGPGDDADLDRLWDDCEFGELLACDRLAEMSFRGTPYREFAVSCGNRREPGAPCAFTVGDSPELDELWFACDEGDMGACDVLYQESPVDSEYEAFGFTCGYRTGGGNDCTAR